MAKILKIVFALVVLSSIFAGAYYLNIIPQLSTAVDNFRADTLAFVPPEGLLFIALLTLALLVSAVYSFIPD